MLLAIRRIFKKSNVRNLMAIQKVEEQLEENQGILIKTM